jgi:ribose transport system substrate-binding protein
MNSPNTVNSGRARRALGAGVTMLVALVLVTGCGSGSAGGGAARPGATSGAQRVGTPADFVDMSQVCGDKDITVGLADGYGASAWRKIARAELEDEAKKCPHIKKVIYTDAQGSEQKAISDINSLVSLGVGAIVIVPDAGPALIPATRNAMRAGVSVTIVPGDLGGKIGQDYTAAVYDIPQQNGRTWAEWMVKTLGGKGNVVFLGGTPSNPVTPLEAVGVREVLAKHPGMKLLAGPVDTNWDIAQTQKVMTGLLTKYPRIDGVISDYGVTTVGAVRAFTAAGRPLVPIATNDVNQLSCMWKDLSPRNPHFELATVSARSWLIRPALRQAVGAAEGKPDPEPAVIKLPLFEDSTSHDPSRAVRCERSLPPSAIVSASLPKAEQARLFGQ